MYEEFFKKLAEECEIRNRFANTAHTYTNIEMDEKNVTYLVKDYKNKGR